VIAWVVALQVAGEATVRGRPSSPPVASTRVEAREARDLPGALGDFARAADAMPGAGRASFGAGDLILWGAPPSRSAVLVGGVPIPRLFHGGGLRSVLQGFFVGSMELSPGAFGVEYGRATGGTLSLSTAALPERETRAAVSLDLLDGSFVASRALTDRARVALGVRTGYAADVLRAVAPAAFGGLVNLPRYSDYQARFEYRPAPRATLSVMAFGSLDAASLALPSDDDSRGRSLATDTSFLRVVASYSLDAGGARSIVRAWAGRDFDARRERVGSLPSDSVSDRLRGGVRASHAFPLAAGATLRAGLDAEVSSTAEERVGSLARPAREGDLYVLGQSPPGDVRGDRWQAGGASAGLWCEVPWSLAGGAFTVTPALRVDFDATEVSRALPPLGDTPVRGLARFEAIVQPRVAVGLRLARHVSLRAAAGRFYAPPDPAALSATFGNPALSGVLAWHAVVGARLEVERRLEVSVDAFARTESGVASRSESPDRGAALANTGTTETVGVQVMLRLARGQRLSGWLAYTALRGTVTDRPGGPERLSDYDQTHLFAAVTSVALGRGWRVGARARLTSGFPRTAVVARTLDALTGDFEPVFGPHNVDRLPLFFSLDVRVDRTFRVGGAEVTVFVDVLNATNHLNAEEVVYDPGFRERRYVTGIPIVADIGVRGEL